jgi:hypothetical protein
MLRRLLARFIPSIARRDAAERTLLAMGYQYRGGRTWRPPSGELPDLFSGRQTPPPLQEEHGMRFFREAPPPDSRYLGMLLRPE